MNFDHILLRLKQELKISTDKEVAELLGLSKTAFAERKRRNAFPKNELFVLATKRPEFSIDTYFVLTGERLPPEQGGEHFKSWAMEQGKNDDENSAELVVTGMLEHAEKRKKRKNRTDSLVFVLDNLDDDDFDLILNLTQKIYDASILRHTSKRK